MNKLITLVYRILFVGSVALGVLVVWEKLANLVGLTVTRGFYSNFQLLEFAAIGLLYVIALQLREIKNSSKERD